MPRSKAPRRKVTEEYDFLSVRTTGFDVRLSAGVNSYLFASPGLISVDDCLYTASSWIEVSGECIEPSERAGEQFIVTLVSERDGSRLRFDSSVRDIQKRDDNGRPMFKPYRGVSVPVFEVPPGITLLTRSRKGEPWRAYLSVPPRFLSDCLASLTGGTAPYIYIHERKVGRQRWINSLSLQTADPSE